MSLTKKQLEDVIAGLNEKLEKMERKLDALNGLPETVARLEATLEASNARNANLIEALEHKEKELMSMQLKLNSIEQHNRSWSIRINGMAVSNEVEKNAAAMKQAVFHNLLQPILAGAVECGDLLDVPPAEQLLETVHVLPAKDGVKPILARFLVRDMRGLVFKHKKEYAPREKSTSPDRPGRYIFPFFEDLTAMTFKKMRAIADHPEVTACWSSRGQLRFKTKSNDTVRKVVNLLDSVENIVK